MCPSTLVVVIINPVTLVSLSPSGAMALQHWGTLHSHFHSIEGLRAWEAGIK
jgi:hypothetical protein